MCIRIFLDANVLIDVVQNRIDFVEASSKILQLGLDGRCELWVSDITMVTVAYYAKRHRTIEQFYHVMCELRSILNVVSPGVSAIDWALQQRNKDFEDTIQYYAAKWCGTEYIITRNERDYPYTDIPAVSPTTFLKLIGAE